MFKLHVVLTGCVMGGFIPRAILPEGEARHRAVELKQAGVDGVWVAPVTAPKDVATGQADPSGEFLTVFGDFGTGFKLVGPFASDPEAVEYGEMCTGEIDDHDVYSVVAVESSARTR